MDNEFTADSNGHCLFCLNFIQESNKLRNIHSLQYFSKYLKVDRRKVFSDDTQVSQTLLDKVEKSILKVELCQKCSKLNTKCTDILEQIEKLEINLSFYLGLISSIFTKSTEKEKLIESMEPGKFEIFDRIRNETIKKCKSKTSSNCLILPVVQIEKMSENDVNEQRLKMRTRSEKQQKMNKNESNLSSAKIEIFDSFDLHEFSEDISNSGSGGDQDIVDGQEKIVKKVLKFHKTVRTKPGLVPAPIEIFGKKLPGPIRNMSVVNGETGKTTCRLCNRQFNQLSRFTEHYNKIHLQLKFKCSVCNTEFNVKTNYERHFMSVHLKSKFTCNLCRRKYSDRSNLKRHKKTVHSNHRNGRVKKGRDNQSQINDNDDDVVQTVHVKVERINL